MIVMAPLPNLKTSRHLPNQKTGSFRAQPLNLSYNGAIRGDSMRKVRETFDFTVRN